MGEWIDEKIKCSGSGATKKLSEQASKQAGVQNIKR